MKITRATLKSFINKNKSELYINIKRSFDGRVDCVTECDNGFSKIASIVSNDYFQRQEKYTMGIQGLWLVGQSRDYFQTYDDGMYQGISISNCCGLSILAVKKTI